MPAARRRIPRFSALGILQPGFLLRIYSEYLQLSHIFSDFYVICFYRFFHKLIVEQLSLSSALSRGAVLQFPPWEYVKGGWRLR